MQMHTFRLRVFTLLAGITALTVSCWACADPPSRVARLGYFNGEVSFSPDGENDWDHATLDRPLGTGCTTERSSGSSCPCSRQATPLS